MASNDKKIKGYQQGAAECLKLQRQMAAEGKHDVARRYAKAVDANLDAASALKKQSNS